MLLYYILHRGAYLQVQLALSVDVQRSIHLRKLVEERGEKVDHMLDVVRSRRLANGVHREHRAADVDGTESVLREHRADRRATRPM